MTRGEPQRGAIGDRNTDEVSDPGLVELPLGSAGVQNAGEQGVEVVDTVRVNDGELGNGRPGGDGVGGGAADELEETWAGLRTDTPEQAATDWNRREEPARSEPMR